MLGFGVKGIREGGPWFACAFLRAHSPALGHACADSVRWSPQYELVSGQSEVSIAGTVDTYTPFARFTFEWKKVQLATVFGLAVSPNCFYVAG